MGFLRMKSAIKPVSLLKFTLNTQSNLASVLRAVQKIQTSRSLKKQNLQKEIIKIIEDSCHLTIYCLISKNQEELLTKQKEMKLELQPNSKNYVKKLEVNQNKVQFYKSILSNNISILLLGSVNTFQEQTMSQNTFLCFLNILTTILLLDEKRFKFMLFLVRIIKLIQYLRIFNQNVKFGGLNEKSKLDMM
ncbi:unnamed protein product [Paramecium octaurelia]|uniref:Uncharacterized protein n=1 Tax=Paramecium octaurelia TaxID=43137 RepID=A0A8S1TV81_PAROT|nr:unnamed protein product [Paramecium octaurelia]